MTEPDRSRPRGRAGRWAGVTVAMGVALLAAGPMPAATAPVIDLIASPERPEDIIALPDGRHVLVSAIAAKPGDRDAGLHVIDSRTLTAAPLALASAAKADPSACGPALPAGTLKPHGLDLTPGAHGGGRLHVVNHGARESIEIYQVDLAGGVPVAHFVTCVLVPDGVFANAVVALPGGGLVISKMFDTGDPDHAQRMGRGEKTGEVLRWTPGSGWRTVPGSALSGANGLLTTPDGDAVIVAAWSERRLVRVPLSGAGPVVRSPELPYMPDNLRWSAAGNILVTGQTTDVADGWKCLMAEGPCPAALFVQELDPLTLTPRTIAHLPDAGFGMASVAAAVGSDIWVGAVVGDRILRIRRGEPDGG